MNLFKFSLGNKVQNINILLYSILMFCTLNACTNHDKEYIDLPYDPQTIPSMRTDSVSMLISDSGIIRYKFVTPDWQIFDNVSNPYWYFPKGIYMEQFDTLLNKQITLKADTAWNYSREKKWKLKNNVFIKNIKDETFKSDELIWDEKQQKFSSDRYIEINRPNRLMLKGYGFESNQDMTQYRIFNPFDTKIIVEDKNHQQDSI